MPASIGDRIGIDDQHDEAVHLEGYLTDAPFDSGEIEYDESYGMESEWAEEINSWEPIEKNRKIKPYIKKPIPSKLRWQVFKRDAYLCVRCDADEDLTVDHIHPEVKGGQATMDNLQTLCRPCNSSKGAR